MSRLPAMTYQGAGVDSERAVQSLVGLTNQFRRTWTRPKGEVGSVRLDFGLFANVIEIGNNKGIAVTTDGVGSKVLIAQRMGKYETIGIDCVAMNVNDLLCVGATPWPWWIISRYRNSIRAACMKWQGA